MMTEEYGRELRSGTTVGDNSQGRQPGMIVGDGGVKAGVHNDCPVWTSLHNNQKVGTTRDKTGSTMQPPPRRREYIETPQTAKLVRSTDSSFSDVMIIGGATYNNMMSQ